MILKRLIPKREHHFPGRFSVSGSVVSFPAAQVNSPPVAFGAALSPRESGLRRAHGLGANARVRDCRGGGRARREWRPRCSSLSGLDARRKNFVPELQSPPSRPKEASTQNMMPEVYWIRDVEPLRLAIMPRPRGGEWLPDEVSGWKRLGIDVVVSLLHPYEADELDISAEESLCQHHEIRYRSFPIQDRGTPQSVVEFLALADEIAASLKQGLAVTVHCRAGIGRSGLLAACVLLRLGVNASNAFAVVSKARGLTVPDTSAQIEWFHSMAARCGEHRTGALRESLP